MQTNHENWTQTGVKSSALRGWVCNINISREFIFHSLLFCCQGCRAHWLLDVDATAQGLGSQMKYNDLFHLMFIVSFFLVFRTHLTNTMAFFSNTCKCVSLDTKKIWFCLHLNIFASVLCSCRFFTKAHNCRPKHYLNILTVRQSHRGCQAQDCD